MTFKRSFTGCLPLVLTVGMWATGSAAQTAVISQGNPALGATATVPAWPTVGYVDMGAFRVVGNVALDAATPAFLFSTFEITAGSSLSFFNLAAGHTLRLAASESVGIFGTLDAPAGSSVVIEAPELALAAGGRINSPGGWVQLVSSGSLTISGVVDVGQPSPGGPNPAEPILVGAGGGLQLPPGLPVSLSPAPSVPEPETYAMLLVGLGVVGLRVQRRRARREFVVPRGSACLSRTALLCDLSRF